MTSRALLAAAVASLTVVAPAVARADEPCAAEADAAQKAARRDGGDPALAPPTDPAAIAHMKEGNARATEGVKRASLVATRDQAPAEFKAAIEAYGAGFLVSSTPSLLYNLAQAYRAAGDYPSAIEQYRAFLKRAKPRRQLRALIECHIAAMTAEQERAAASAPPRGPADDPPPPADVTPRGLAASAAPPASDPDLALRAEVPGPAEAPRWHADTLGWGIAGGGAAVAGVGVFLLLDARSLRNQADDEPRDDVRAELDDKAAGRTTWGTVTTVAGAAILAVGIVKLAITPDAPTVEHARLSLSLSPGGFALGGRF